MTEPIHDISVPNTFLGILEHCKNKYSFQPAFTFKENDKTEEKSFNSFYDDIAILANSIQDLGLSEKTISICAENSYKWCTSFMAIICSGGIAVPIDKSFPENDIKNILLSSQSQAIFCDKAIKNKLSKIDLPETKIICFDDEYNALVCDTKPKAILNVSENEASRLSMLMYTSGTTGLSKAVMLTQNNVCSDIEAVLSMIDISPYKSILALLPFHHSYGAFMTFLACFYSGLKIILGNGIKYMIKDIHDFKPEMLIIVPLILNHLYKYFLKENNAADNVFSSVKIIVSGGAPANHEIIDYLIAKGIRTFQGYGLTECSPILICNNDLHNKSDSIGMPIAYTEIRIKEPDKNGIGEISAKGPMITNGYYNDEIHTKEIFDEDGWFCTGDIGRKDENGFYYICGRCKNVIVTDNGKNVFPEELEFLLQKYSCIKECIVKETRNSKGAVIITAEIFPDYNNENYENEIKNAIDEVNSQVASFKAIHKTELRTKEFEKTSTSKVKRNK